MAKKRLADAMPKKYIDKGYGRWLDETNYSDGIGMGGVADLVSDAMDIMKRDESNAEKNGCWRGALAIPPGSFIETMAVNFQRNSSIAPELAVMGAFAYFAAFLCKNEIRLDVQGVIEWPTLWLAILAGSGAGKTTSLDFLEYALEVEIDQIPGAEVPSAKAFLEKLEEKPNALFVVDEMGPFFANAKDQSYMAELPPYLLHIYTHKTIDRSTGGKTLRVENPVLSVLGYSAKGSFFQNFDPIHFASGLAQRFAWIIVDNDPKPTGMWKLRKPEVIEEIQERWSRIARDIVPGTIYKFPDESTAERAFETAYSLLNPDGEIPDGFFRRMMHGAAMRYALIYHILLGKAGQVEIDEEDVAWATRLAYLHAVDTKKILMEANLGRLGGLLKKAEELAKRIHDKEQRDITPRDIVRNLNAVKTTSEAKSLLAMLESAKRE